MPARYETLTDFLSQLEDDVELVRVAAPVASDLEVAAITNHVCQQPGGGPALLFENVDGQSIPLVTNLLGSRRRLCRAFRSDSFSQVAERIVALIQPDVPDGWLDALQIVPQFTQLTRLPPKPVPSGVCQQVVYLGGDVELDRLPVPRCWPEESHPVLTSALVFTQNPETGLRHVRRYPVEILGRDQLAIHWNVVDPVWPNLDLFRRRARPMPLAVVLGGDPAFLYAGSAPLPAYTDACLFAGFLQQQNVKLVKCRTNDLYVPANAEIVIEGVLDPNRPAQPAGPIAWPTGFYGAKEQLPTVQVTAVTHRSNPLLPAFIPSPPPSEDTWISKATERLFLPLVQLFVPEVADLAFLTAGAGHNLTFVSIRKQYAGQARKVLNALWGLDYLATTKVFVVVDAEADLTNEQDVWFRVGAYCHPGRDVVFCEGPTHATDHAAPVRGLGHKMGLDATRKLSDEGHPREWPGRLESETRIRELVIQRWDEYGLPQAANPRPRSAATEFDQETIHRPTA